MADYIIAEIGTEAEPVRRLWEPRLERSSA